MIFLDKLQSSEEILIPEFDRLIRLALKKQSHIGDLLLLNINGFYDERISEFSTTSGEKCIPYAFGPGSAGHSEQDHNNFIHNYWTNNMSNFNSSDFFMLHELSQAPNSELTELIDLEEISIQFEMLIYIKFWEADMIIKRLYQLVRILYGESYDWYFKIKNSQSDKNATGSRQEILRYKIRDRLKDVSPILYNLIKNSYKTQIRNSIAHSNYSFHDRYIQLNNFIKDEPSANLLSISFDDWIDMFHNTLVLHNQYIKMNDMINDFYVGYASKFGNKMEIRLTEADGKQSHLVVEYSHEIRDWAILT